MKTVKRKAKSATPVWKELYLTVGYHSHTARAAKGGYCITPTFEREVQRFVSQVDDCDTRYLCGKPGHGIGEASLECPHLRDDPCFIVRDNNRQQLAYVYFRRAASARRR